MKTFIQKGNPALNQAELFKYQPHDTDNEWMDGEARTRFIIVL